MVADHVLANTLCLFFGLSSDLAVDVKTCVAPAENFLNQRETDEFFPDNQREDLMGEDFLNKLILETADTVKSTIRGCASFSNHRVNAKIIHLTLYFLIVSFSISEHRF